MTRLRFLSVAVVLASACFTSLTDVQAAENPAPAFPLKENDLVVMLGDSITAQHLHSNYFEAYCVTRFPKWNLRFRNSGVPGHTISTGLARFDYDVANWKPTVVTIEFGMNDLGGGAVSVPTYTKNIPLLPERVTAIGARPIYLTASPVNDGTGSTDKGGRNEGLHLGALAVVDYSKQHGIPCADQFHVLADLWKDNAAKGDGKVSLTGDAVHTGGPGQITMAYALLTGLGAPALVSKATIDAAGGGKVVNATQCQVTDLKKDGDKLSFTRLDACLPMPIPSEARAGLKLVPLTEKLNDYTLTVTGLPAAGKYAVTIDGTKVAEVTAEQLTAGWNMSELTEGPIALQGKSVMSAISRKATEVGAVRDLKKFQSPAWLKDLSGQIETERQKQLAPLMANVDKAEEKIHVAAQPLPHRFELTPVH
jgi:lysophospholipase L1-like esterase